MKVLESQFFAFLFSVSILFSCSSVPKDYLINNDICHYDDDIFKVSKEEMLFDVEKHGKELENEDVVFVNNKNFRNEFWDLGDGDITNKQTNKQTNISKWIRYHNGKIKWIRFEYDFGNTNIGKETIYDQNGNVTKKIDYEKGYEICWAEAIEIVKNIAKKDIKEYEVTSFNLLRNDLNEFPDLKPEWDVTLNGNDEYEEKKYSKKGKKIYVIDGVTGKLIKIKAVRMVYDGMVE